MVRGRVACSSAIHASMDSDHVLEFRLPQLCGPVKLRGVLIRRETPSDQSAVFNVHHEAFAVPHGSVPNEASLVDELRHTGDAIAELSLVAELEGTVTGHVMISRAHVGDQQSFGLGGWCFSARGGPRSRS
jgi:hypothetical protein